MDQPVPDNWWVFFSFLFFLYFFSICTIILFLLLLSLQMLLLTEIFLTYVVGIFEAYRFSYCFLFYTVLGAWQPECVNVAISDFEFSPKAGAWRQCRKVKTKRERRKEKLNDRERVAEKNTFNIFIFFLGDKPGQSF